MPIQQEQVTSVGLSCTPDGAGHCITCSDEAIEAKVVRINTDADMAVVEVENATAEIDVSLIDTVVPGDRVLIHGGVAIAKV